MGMVAENETAARDAEIETNYEAFTAMLPTLMALVPGQYALMRGGQVVATFGDAGGAVTEGYARFGLEPFSIQEVTDKPICLGWYSCVESQPA